MYINFQSALDSFHMVLCFEILPLMSIIMLPLLIIEKEDKKKEKAALAAVKQKRHFFDLDGTLAEFQPEATMDELLSEGYFANLRPLEKNIQALNLLAERGDDVYIISKVLSKRAMKEKDKWLDKYQVNVPKSKRIYVKIDEEKSDYISDLTKEDILYDDYSSNCISWASAGGTAVKILTDINGKGQKFTGTRIKIEEPSQLLQIVDAL